MDGNKGTYITIKCYYIHSYLFSIPYTWVAIKVRTILLNVKILTHIYLVFTYMGDNKGTYISIKC